MFLDDGLYDRLLEAGERDRLNQLAASEVENLDGPELADYLAFEVAQILKSHFENLGDASRQVDFANRVLEFLPGGLRLTETKLLSALVSQTSNEALISSKPSIPLSQLGLITNSPLEPKIGAELVAELASAESVDIIMSFIKVAGVRIIYDALKEANARGVKVRILTTAYLGATEAKAIEQLTEDLGVEIRIDYLARSNRLHAKGWLIRRATGFHTAYIGSSNVSAPALGNGLEWNVKLSAQRSPEVLEKFEATFESYWNSKNFERFDPAQDKDKLDEALARASNKFVPTPEIRISNLDVIPQTHQITMLERVQWERSKGRHANLIVAATGSGKTVMAALDYKRYSQQLGRPARLLFVAHNVRILEQAQNTFCQVMRDSGFGEILGGGREPVKWQHVFATVQSLNSRDYFDLDADAFEFVIVDEIHHAEAPTYRRLLSYFRPKELLGLTATPERFDGKTIQEEFFDGHISFELRLWDALNAQLLAPFDYFAIGEKLDLRHISWTSKGYSSSELSNLVTRDDIRNKLMLNELQRKVPSLATMKALFYCVDVSHARHVKAFLNSAGIRAETVVGETTLEERDEIIRSLSKGEIQAITCVDVFTEGFDLPAIDTLVMLRPTESPVVFLQQLGRGLRISEGKEVCLVLDFVGVHNAKYRLDRKLRALTNRRRGELISDLQHGFPFLPSGMSLNLDAVARKNILDNLKMQLAPNKNQLVADIRDVGTQSLDEFMMISGRELEDLYRLRISWNDALHLAGLKEQLHPAIKLGSRIGNLLHVDDEERIENYLEILTGDFMPWAKISGRARRFRNMLFWQLWRTGSDDQGHQWQSVDQALQVLRSDRNSVEELETILRLLEKRIESLRYPLSFVKNDIPLYANAHYTLDEMLGAIGYARLETSPLDSSLVLPTRRADSMRQGVAFEESELVDLLTVTLQKTKGYSPTTRYRDYAETSELFHWQSQSTTTSSSETGQRYLNQKRGSNDVLLAVRSQKTGVVGTESYTLLGLADFEKSSGEKPITIWWNLRQEMSTDSFSNFAAYNVA